MKRYLSLALIVLMLPALLAVPALADEYEANTWLDVLDYGYSSLGTNMFSVSSGQKVFYSLPYEVISKGVDLVFYSSKQLSSVQFYRYATSEPVNVVVSDLGGGYYRAFNTSGNGYSSVGLAFTFSDGGSGYIEIFSLRLNLSDFETYYKVVEGSIKLNYPDSIVNRNVYYYPHDDGWYADPIEFSSDGSRISWYSTLNIKQWQTMDFVQLSLSSYTGSIDSVHVQCKGVNVPFVYSMPTSNTVNGHGQPLYLIDLLIDVGNLSKELGVDLTVMVTGSLAPNSSGNFVIQSCFGLVDVEPPNVLVYWFQNVGNWISSQTSSLVSSISSWGQSLLDGINSLPDKIVEALQSLFVPSDSAVQDMGQQSEELAQDRFGGAYEGALIIDEFASQLRPQQATQILTVPVVNLDILGVPFPLGGWDVDLVPDGTEIVVETCKIVIDILATLAFINGLRNRLERTLER